MGSTPPSRCGAIFKKYPAYATGLTWVVLTIVVELLFLNGHRLALPIMARLNPKAPASKKKGRGSAKKHITVSLKIEMIHRIGTRMLQRQFVFCGDGAFMVRLQTSFRPTLSWSHASARTPFYSPLQPAKRPSRQDTPKRL